MTMSSQQGPQIDPYIQQMVELNPGNKQIQQLALQSYMQQIDQQQQMQQQQQMMQMFGMGGGQGGQGGVGGGPGGMGGDYSQYFTNPLYQQQQQPGGELEIEIPDEQSGGLAGAGQLAGKAALMSTPIGPALAGLEMGMAGRPGGQGTEAYMSENKPFGLYPLYRAIYGEKGMPTNKESLQWLGQQGRKIAPHLSPYLTEQMTPERTEMLGKMGGGLSPMLGMAKEKAGQGIESFLENFRKKKNLVGSLAGMAGKFGMGQLS